MNKLDELAQIETEVRSARSEVELAWKFVAETQGRLARAERKARELFDAYVTKELGKKRA